MNYREEYQKWCNSPVFDRATREELLSLCDEKEIEDRFYKELSFGTGGLRGVVGAGTNRMNDYTVGKATQGLANFIKSRTESGSVVIAYDSRKMSYEFAVGSALIFAANGIKCFLFESLRPTPELSFAVRELEATAGIVITASHNPPQYNGYKVYWSDGGQIVAPYDKLILAEIKNVKDYAAIKRIGKEEALKSGLICLIGKEIDNKYDGALKSLILNSDTVKRYAKDIKIVYTPLNGTGNIPVRRILHDLGFEQVWVVPEQEQPDGNFPTLEFPNPEDPKAFTYALALAREKDAEIVLATDPDADRLGIYVKDAKTAEYIPFTGNMSGALIAEYILSQKDMKGLLPTVRRNGAVITTIVSSKIAFDIAAAYGLTVIEVLTGFKYIGEQIEIFEQAKNKNGGVLDHKTNAYEFEFGFEESYGCLAGTYARDKDAVAAVMILCEAAAYYKSKGLTLWDQMQNIYRKYGYYVEDLQSVTLEGVDGLQRINKIMNELRGCPPKNIGKIKVLAFRDYECGVRMDFANASKQIIDLPKSNVLYFELENNGWFCVRPSGTEPKIKFYFGVKGPDLQTANDVLNTIKKYILSYVQK